MSRVLSQLVAALIALCAGISSPAIATSAPPSWPLLAQSRNLGLSPQDQQRHDELIKSARDHVSQGILATRVVLLAFAYIFFKAAYDVYRKGFKLSANKTIKGLAGNAIATIFVVVGYVIAVGGWIAIPLMLDLSPDLQEIKLANADYSIWKYVGLGILPLLIGFLLIGIFLLMGRSTKTSTPMYATDVPTALAAWELSPPDLPLLGQLGRPSERKKSRGELLIGVLIFAAGIALVAVGLSFFSNDPSKRDPSSLAWTLGGIGSIMATVALGRIAFVLLRH